MIEYRFSINGHSVKPVYNNDLSKEYAIESEQRFFRAELVGSLTFLREDYTWIYSQNIETEFVVLIEKSNDSGLTWSNYFTGSFFRTDCKINEDSKKIVTKIVVKDKYTELLAGLEKEYDLIKLTPAKTPVMIQKRPLIQVYILGSTSVSCFLGGNSWEQETAFSIESETDIVSIYHFALSTTLNRFEVSGESVLNNILGDYVNEGAGNAVLSGPNGAYRIEYQAYPEESSPGVPTGNTLVDYHLYRESDDVELYESLANLDPIDTVTLTAVSGSGATGILNLYVFTPLKVYQRYLLDVDLIGIIPTYPIPSEDLVGNNRNYKRVIGYSTNLVTVYNHTSVNPTEYGLTDDEKYFLPPYSPGVKFYPIARGNWGYNSSIWFNFDLFDFVLEEEARKDYILKDSILISNAIKVLLNEIDPTLEHEALEEYSQFLYGEDTPVTFYPYKLFITAKSNLTAGEYEQPARKALIKLSAILSAMKQCFKCYWHLDGNKFIIEHISYYKNGGSYSGTPVLAVDLTTLTNFKNSKTWGFNTSDYDYEKAQLAERFEFKWMDEVTEGFTGYPIEILSKFVQRGKIESIQVSNFTSDVDYMLLNPEDISKEGFALLGAVLDDDLYKLVYLERTIDGAELKLQNGLLSWVFLQPNYWLHDLPANHVVINKETYTSVEGIERRKKQKVVYNSIDDPDPMKLIKTYIGDGEIEKISINLQSRKNEINLRYDTE